MNKKDQEELEAILELCEKFEKEIYPSETGCLRISREDMIALRDLKL